MNRLDPRSRVVSAVIFALLVVGLQHTQSCLIALAIAAVMAVSARLPLRPTLYRLLSMDGFMVLTVGLLPFTTPGDAWLSLGGVSITRQGADSALIILLKANAVSLMMLALLGSMETVTLGHALGRLGLPDKMVHLFLFTVRYLDVLRQEYGRLRTAMRARAFCMGGNRHTWRSVGYLFGMLLVRSMERSDRILAAMRCRGFADRFPSLDDPSHFQWHDKLFAAASMAGLVLVMAVDII